MIFANEPVRNLARGLVKLMRTEKADYFNDIYDCESETYIFPHHPLGYSFPKNNGDEGIRECRLIGYQAPDLALEAFYANIRQYIGYWKGSLVRGLRVITAPWEHKGASANQHRVFFEVWVGDRAIIMGETNDFSGSANTAREEMEDVMYALSVIHRLVIMRENQLGPVDMMKLYRCP